MRTIKPMILLSACGLLAAGCATRGPRPVFTSFAEDASAVLAEKAARRLAAHPEARQGLSRALFIVWGMDPERAEGAPWPNEDWSERSFIQTFIRDAGAAGLWVYTEWCDAQRLREFIQAGIPMGCVRSGESAWDRTRDWCVTLGMSERLNGMALFGPQGPVVVSQQDFMKEWCEGGYTVRACPPARIRWQLSAQEHLSLGRFYEHRNAWREAIQHYSEAAQRLPPEKAPHVRMGNVYQGMGARREAAEQYRMAIRQDPGNGSAYNNLAYLHAERRESLEEAEQLARQAYHLEPDNPKFIDTLGFVLYLRKQYNEAERLLEQARGKARNYPVKVQVAIAAHLAAVYDAAGQVHLRKQVVADILKMNPDYPVPDAWIDEGEKTTGNKKKFFFF